MRALLGVLTLVAAAGAADPVRIIAEPAQRLDMPFRMYRTENYWNQIMLDTRTGQAWQCQITVDEKGTLGCSVINGRALAQGKAPGRFTLFPTDNMYNFFLVDQVKGEAYQLQWSTDGPEKRFIRRIPFLADPPSEVPAQPSAAESGN